MRRIKRIPIPMDPTISSALSAYITLPAAPWEEADEVLSPKRRARDMYQQGKTCEEIAIALGVSSSSVQRQVHGRS